MFTLNSITILLWFRPLFFIFFFYSRFTLYFYFKSKVFILYNLILSFDVTTKRSILKYCKKKNGLVYSDINQFWLLARLIKLTDLVSRFSFNIYINSYNILIYFFFQFNVYKKHFIISSKRGHLFSKFDVQFKILYEIIWIVIKIKIFKDSEKINVISHKNFLRT